MVYLIDKSDLSEICKAIAEIAPSDVNLSTLTVDTMPDIIRQCAIKLITITVKLELTDYGSGEKVDCGLAEKVYPPIYRYGEEVFTYYYKGKSYDIPLYYSVKECRCIMSGDVSTDYVCYSLHEGRTCTLEIPEGSVRKNNKTIESGEIITLKVSPEDTEVLV